MIHTFAAIYIGSYEVSIKIFEISGKKKIRDIDYIRSRIELGRDAYSKGSIGYELVEALCDTLAEYKNHGRLPGGQLRSICCRSLEKR